MTRLGGLWVDKVLPISLAHLAAVENMQDGGGLWTLVVAPASGVGWR